MVYSVIHGKAALRIGRIESKKERRAARTWLVHPTWPCRGQDLGLAVSTWGTESDEGAYGP